MQRNNISDLYRSFFKRLVDFTGALIGLFLLSPLLLLIAGGLALSNKGKAFFIQPRPGKDEKIFHIIKFKTMNDEKDKDGNLLPDAERLTTIGNFVRKSSLDEIPQLINVLLGDMSLIGPRPLLVQYLPYYTEKEKARHSVRPGITGWAQVNGRNTINWDEKLELDVEYVKNLSFTLDLKILLKTVQRVVKPTDVLVIPSEFFTTLDKYRTSNGNYSS